MNWKKHPGNGEVAVFDKHRHPGGCVTLLGSPVPCEWAAKMRNQVESLK